MTRPDRINDGGPAFPYLTASETDREVTTHEGEHGMSLRDFFAAKAMQAYISSYPRGEAPAGDAIALDSYDMADEMLKARQQ